MSGQKRGLINSEAMSPISKDISSKSMSPILKDTSSVNSDTAEFLLNSQEDTIDKFIAKHGVSMSPCLTDNTNGVSKSFVYDSVLKDHLATPFSPLSPKNKFRKPTGDATMQNPARTSLELQSSSGDENSLTENFGKRKFQRTSKSRKKSNIASFTSMLSFDEKTDASLFRSPVGPPAKGRAFKKKPKARAAHNTFSGILDSSESEMSFSSVQPPARGKVFKRKTETLSKRIHLDDGDNSSGSEMSFNANSHRKKSIFRPNPANAVKRLPSSKCFEISNSSDNCSQESVSSKRFKHSDQGKKFKEGPKDAPLEGCKEFGDALFSDSSASCKSANNVSIEVAADPQKSNATSLSTSKNSPVISTDFNKQNKSISLTNLDISSIEPNKAQDEHKSANGSFSLVSGNEISTKSTNESSTLDFSKNNVLNNSQARTSRSSREKSPSSRSGNKTSTESTNESSTLDFSKNNVLNNSQARTSRSSREKSPSSRSGNKTSTESTNESSTLDFSKNNVLNNSQARTSRSSREKSPSSRSGNKTSTESADKSDELDVSKSGAQNNSQTRTTRSSYEKSIAFRSGNKISIESADLSSTHNEFDSSTNGAQNNSQTRRTRSSLEKSFRSGNKISIESADLSSTHNEFDSSTNGAQNNSQTRRTRSSLEKSLRSGNVTSTESADKSPVLNELDVSKNGAQNNSQTRRTRSSLEKSLRSGNVTSTESADKSPVLNELDVSKNGAQNNSQTRRTRSSLEKSSRSGSVTSTELADKSSALNELDVSKNGAQNNSQTKTARSSREKSLGSGSETSSESVDKSPALNQVNVSKNESQNNSRTRTTRSSREKALESHPQVDIKELEKSMPESCNLSGSQRKSLNRSDSSRSLGKNEDVTNISGSERRQFQSGCNKSDSYKRFKTNVENRLSISGLESSQNQCIAEESNASVKQCTASDLKALSDLNESFDMLNELELVAQAPSSLCKSTCSSEDVKKTFTQETGSKGSSLKNCFARVEKSKSSIINTSHVAENLSRSYSLRSQSSKMTDLESSCENTSVHSVSCRDGNSLKASVEISPRTDARSRSKENLEFTSGNSTATTSSSNGKPNIIAGNNKINFRNYTFNSENELIQKNISGNTESDNFDLTHDSPCVDNRSQVGEGEAEISRKKSVLSKNHSTSTNSNEEPDDLPNGNSTLPSYRVSNNCSKSIADQSSLKGRKSSVIGSILSDNSSGCLSKNEQSFGRRSSLGRSTADKTSPTIASDYSTVAEFSLLASNQFDSSSSQLVDSEVSLVRRSVRVSDRVSDRIVRISPLPNITELDYEVTANCTNELTKSVVEENMRLHISDEPHVSIVNCTFSDDHSNVPSVQSSKALNKTIDNSDILTQSHCNSNKKTSLRKSASSKVLDQSSQKALENSMSQKRSARIETSLKLRSEASNGSFTFENGSSKIVTLPQRKSSKETSPRISASPKVLAQSIRENSKNSMDQSRASKVGTSLNSHSVAVDVSQSFEDGSFEITAGEGLNNSRKSLRRSVSLGTSKSLINKTNSSRKSRVSNSAISLEAEISELSTKKSDHADDNSEADESSRNSININNTENNLEDESVRDTMYADNSKADVDDGSVRNTIHADITEADVDNESVRNTVYADNTEANVDDESVRNTIYADNTEADADDESVRNTVYADNTEAIVDDESGRNIVSADNTEADVDNESARNTMYVNNTEANVDDESVRNTDYADNTEADVDDDSMRNTIYADNTEADATSNGRLSYGQTNVTRPSIGSQFETFFRKPHPPVPPRLRKLRNSHSLSNSQSSSGSVSLFSKCIQSKRNRGVENEPTEASAHHMNLRKRNPVPKTAKLSRPAYWVTNRLYSFLIEKLEPVYNITSKHHAEKFVQFLQGKCKQLAKEVDEESCEKIKSTIKERMIELMLVNSDFLFYNFVQDYLPHEIHDKVVPTFIPFSTVPPVRSDRSMFTKYF